MEKMSGILETVEIMAVRDPEGKMKLNRRR